MILRKRKNNHVQTILTLSGWIRLVPVRDAQLLTLSSNMKRGEATFDLLFAADAYVTAATDSDEALLSLASVLQQGHTQYVCMSC